MLLLDCQFCICWLAFIGAGACKRSENGHQWDHVAEDKKSSINIVIYAENQSDIDAGIQSLDNLMDRDFQRKEIKEQIIHDFTPNQVSWNLVKTYLISNFATIYLQH